MSDAMRIVLTGLGAVTPLGPDAETFFARSLEGRSGVGPIEHFDAAAFPVRFGGYCKEFDAAKYINPREVKRLDRFCHLATGAGDMALAHAGIDHQAYAAKDRLGIVMASGIGGIDEILEQTTKFVTKGPDRVGPMFVPKMMINSAAGALAMRYGCTGPNLATTSACASSSHAVAVAFAFLRAGYADVILAGGAEAALTPLGLAAFCSMRALSTRNEEPQRASRPFDVGRDGFVMGEGAGAVVLETLAHAKARGARILAELVGVGMSDDAHHITAPAPGGAGAAQAMRAAMREARLAPEDVGHVNAHGTSTPLGDVAETEALKAVLGDHARKAPISATKSQIGHLLGAAGVMGLIAASMAMTKGVLPPTINLDDPDPACDLDYVPKVAREHAFRAALVNSFGFGGHNVSLAIRRFEG